MLEWSRLDRQYLRRPRRSVVLIAVGAALGFAYVAISWMAKTTSPVFWGLMSLANISAGVLWIAGLYLLLVEINRIEGAGTEPGAPVNAPVALWFQFRVSRRRVTEQRRSPISQAWVPSESKHFSFMCSIQEIEAAIETLPPEQFLLLRELIQKRFDEQWDRQFGDDATNGKLDAVAESAIAEHRAGSSTPFLPNAQ
jgi:hypothetical protein